MKKNILLLLFVMSFVFSANSTYGLSSKELSLARYDEEKKDPWLSVGASWLFPSLGHAYSDDWGRGFPFLLGDIAGIVIMVSGIQTSSDSYQLPGGSSYSYSTTTYTSQYYLGLGMLLIFRIWEYFDSYDSAVDYNIRLKEKYGLIPENRLNKLKQMKDQNLISNEEFYSKKYDLLQ